MPNLYRKGKYIWCWGYDAEGERWWESTRQTDERKAEQVARRIERRRLLGPRQPAVPLLDALERLREHKVRKGVTEATLSKTREKGRQLMRVFGPQADVASLTLERCERYMAQRMAETTHEKSKRTVSRHTVAMELNVLREALRHLGRHGLYAGDPNAIMPSECRDAYKPRDRWLPVPEYRKLWMTCPKHRRDHLTAYCFLGVRHSELYRITGEGLDVEGRRVWVPGTKTDDAPRWVPVADDLWPVLERRLERYGDGALFPDRWCKNVINRTLADACARAKIGKVTTNDLRRTFCSWLCNAGVPEIQTAKLMGHTSSLMVRRVYAQLADDTLRGAVDRLPRVTDVSRDGGKNGRQRGRRGRKKAGK